MKIKLNLSIFLFLFLFYITDQLKLYILIMVFAFIHELAHLICGFFLGFKPCTLRIIPFGFSIEFKTNIEDYNKKVMKSNLLSLKQLFIALAGPIINIIIVIIGLIFKINLNIIYANLLIALFNLLPIYSLDGGRILKNILRIFLGHKLAARYINIISNITFILLTILFSIYIIILKNISLFIIIIYLFKMIIDENKRYNTYVKISKIIDKNYNYL